MTELEGPVDAPQYRVVRLAAEHDRRGFASGEPSLDDYLRTRAGQDERRPATIVYVLPDPDDPGRIMGYYSLSTLSVEPTDLPDDVAKQLPRYPDVPALLIGRLAVDGRDHGKGFGGLMLADALERAITLSMQAGCALVVVDALHARAAAFYAHHGFRTFIHRSDRLFLPLKTLLAGKSAAGS